MGCVAPGKEEKLAGCEGLTSAPANSQPRYPLNKKVGGMFSKREKSLASTGIRTPNIPSRAVSRAPQPTN